MQIRRCLGKGIGHVISSMLSGYIPRWMHLPIFKEAGHRITGRKNNKESFVPPWASHSGYFYIALTKYCRSTETEDMLKDSTFGHDIRVCICIWMYPVLVLKQLNPIVAQSLQIKQLLYST